MVGLREHSDRYRARRPQATKLGEACLPAMVTRADDAARFVWAEFFGGQIEIENDHTRRAYWHTVRRVLAWCEPNGPELRQITPAAVGEYLRNLRTRTGSSASKRTRKLQLAAILQLFDHVVIPYVFIPGPSTQPRLDREWLGMGRHVPPAGHGCQRTSSSPGWQSYMHRLALISSWP